MADRDLGEWRCGPGLNLGRRVAAILSAGCSGQGGQGAAVDLLLGVDQSPPASWPKPFLRAQDNSSYLNFPGEEGCRSVRRRDYHRLPGLRHTIQHVSHSFGFDFRTPASGSTTWTCRSRARLQTATLP